MMLPLVERYEPTCLTDVVGQAEAVAWCKQQLASGRPGRAIFAGPSGTGKTSTARIYAKHLLCTNSASATPCGACEGCRSWDGRRNAAFKEISCPELKGIAAVKQLASEIGSVPTSFGNYIVFLDEVQALSHQALDVFLKPLESDSRATVILATSEPEVLPQTIRDRLELVSFKPIEAETLIHALREVCHAEKLDVDADALLTIADFSRGSLRNGRKVLQQATQFQTTVSAETICAVLNLPSSRPAAQILSSMLTGNGQAAIERLQQWKVGDAGDKADLIQRLLLYAFQSHVLGRRYDDRQIALLQRSEISAVAWAADKVAARWPGRPRQSIWRDLIRFWDPQPAETEASLIARADRFVDLLFGPAARS